MPKRILVIKMEGAIEEINSYCEEVGEIANKYKIKVEFE